MMKLGATCIYLLCHRSLNINVKMYSMYLAETKIEKSEEEL